MIQLLATKYNKLIAYFLLIVFECSFISARSNSGETNFTRSNGYNTTGTVTSNRPTVNSSSIKENATPKPVKEQQPKKIAISSNKPFIGGPSQPEMSSFKSVGTDNMVNLFTGDFNYNIPLLDVGGYPVNIFYDGNISPEQDASWVGLGWNINPGTVSRNMRGVPDDFNGDELIQTQAMKPNITLGIEFNKNVEIMGFKKKYIDVSMGRSLDFSYNNYLGPAFAYGIHRGVSFKLAKNASSEKGALKIGANLNVNISSRAGTTVTPTFSLTALQFKSGKGLSAGVGLSTSYNSRVGIKQLKITEQMSYNFHTAIEALNHSANKLTHPIFSTPITFARPTYLPSLRMPVTIESYSGRFQRGGGTHGVYLSKETEVYMQKSYVSGTDKEQKKPLIGYLYYEEAANNANAVVDFTRFNDNEVTPNTPIISAPQYAYDVFTIQGEGTGGSIRAYRNDLGYVRDNVTQSKDKSFSAGLDFGAEHLGGNFNIIKTPTTISEWQNGNKLKNTIGFKPASGINENVYFRNPGETSVIASNQFDNIGGTNLVRFKLGGLKIAPTIEPFIEQFSKTNTLLSTTDIRATPPPERKKRTQVTSFLTAQDAAQIGLEPTIRSYDANTVLTPDNKLSYTGYPRYYNEEPADDTYRKKHHISQINVTEATGRRYIYGIPVYNTIQKDFSFTVKDVPNAEDEVLYDNGANINLSTYKNRDGFLQITQTPAYAHSFLLTGLLSTDYVDVNTDGITEDDLGEAVKFNYTRYEDHQWRTPLTNQPNIANFNDGNRSEKNDDKGLISYGKRESWYLHSIESKTMIALFTVEDRKDGKGAANENSGVDINDNSQKRLQKIDLYSKSDLKKNGLTGATPIKTVRFTYSYKLCANIPTNNQAPEIVDNVNVNQGGKLTLDGIYFTFNGKNRANKNKYVFDYTNSLGGNPSYASNSSDRWGNYKLNTDNPNNIKNADYPFSVQDKSTADKNAGAWALKKILLPSGGQIEVEYESDDYAFVQNKRAAIMMEIAGLGNTSSSFSSKLYLSNKTENDYVFIKVPEACANKTEVFQKYLDGVDQLAFKIAVMMPKGLEYLNAYGTIADYNVDPNDNKRIWIRLNKRDGLSPLTLSALDYLLQRLPGQAYRAYDISDQNVIKQIESIAIQMLEAFANAFEDPMDQMREDYKAQSIIPEKSFVRLNDPDGRKYGGGKRVKSIVLKDNWQAMTGQYTSKYGQQYEYMTTEIFNEIERPISSGVASYEPSIGGEENPFQSIVEVSNKLPLGPASYGAIEMPMLDAFFPAPVVGYSKITVRSLPKTDMPSDKKTRSGIGKQVTEFYTAKDFPVYYNNTLFDPTSDKNFHDESKFSFLSSFIIDSRALSQGFVVEINDMHGKLKSQSSYAEGDENTRINYTENHYRNTGSNGLNEKFDFVYASKGGEVQQGNMGIDIELMTDTREFSVKSNGKDNQANLDHFPEFVISWIPTVWVPKSRSDNTYRAVTTTKVINYHAILDKVVVMDKGSVVTTQNLVYDAETGSVVVNSTKNEFEHPVYNINYPAYWAYSGMGLAYKNINAKFGGKEFRDGKLINMSPEEIYETFESGDELYITHSDASDFCAAEFSGEGPLIWALDKNKNINSLTNPNPDFVFIDKKGKLFSAKNVSFKIVRSGKRNMLNASLASFTSMTDPVMPVNGVRTLVINGDGKMVNASAVEYKEKWQSDIGVIKRYKMVTGSPQNTNINLITNGDFNGAATGLFASEYTYNPNSGSNQGVYTVGTNGNTWYSGFASCKDHTSLTVPVFGRMLMVNGSTTTNKIIWSQTVQVIPGREYYLSAWTQGLNNTSPAQLKFLVNGVQLGSTLTQIGSCFWINYLNVWNSGSNTTATISIVDANIAANGNDFAIDDISFITYDCSEPQEVADCSGYLDKKINPYLKGLLGNFRLHRNMVFYGNRKEKDPSVATNLAQNGFLEEFSSYWNFTTVNTIKLLLPVPNTKWVWNSEITRFNSRGLELETKDALDIYTAAQYGFNKTLPVAITNNSRYLEMFNDGFEDFQYQHSINATSSNECNSKHISFEGLANSEIIPTDNETFNAHTGKYVMRVNGNSTAQKTLSATTENNQNFDLLFGTDALKILNDEGVNFAIDPPDPNHYLNPPHIVTHPINAQDGWSGISYEIFPRPSTSPVQDYYVSDFDFYIDIKETGMYNFTALITASDIYDVYNNPGTLSFYTELILSIADLNGNFKYNKTLTTTSENYPENTHKTDDPSVYLCKGIYHIVGNGRGSYSASYREGAEDFFQINCSNCNSKVYKSLSNSDCNYTTPIAGNGSMQNPSFSIPADKKMVFSAWVRQDCGGNTCNNKVEIDFGNGITSGPLTSSGPIIEGWQRIEGYFTPPQGATTATIKFINASSNAIYFDDIRIHPFNANMKSYVYDPINLRLTAELDANNYATFYEYDEEGTLIRTKAETREGIKTISETRSFKQSTIKQLQQ